MRFVVTNVITMDVEITKSDLKTIVSKNTQDNRFNAFKNKVAQDIRGFLEKSVYEGWREVIPGKHPETAFFAYFSGRNLFPFSLQTDRHFSRYLQIFEQRKQRKVHFSLSSGEKIR